MRRVPLHVDGADAPVGDMAAHEGRVQDAGELDVVDVVATAGDQTRVFDPQRAGADVLTHERASRSATEAASGAVSPPTRARRTTGGSRP